jgi:hypothetical protein
MDQKKVSLELSMENQLSAGAKKPVTSYKACEKSVVGWHGKSNGPFSVSLYSHGPT